MLVNKKLIPFVAGTLSAVMLPAAIAPMLIGDRGAGFDAAVVAAEPPAQSFAKSVKYEPPNRGTPRRTLGSGSRSPDANAQPVALTLLVPNDHTGLTVSGRPTFYWHLSRAVNATLEFSLVEEGVAEPIWVEQVSNNQAGINSLTLPGDKPELSVGKTYRWSVALVVNPTRRSQDIFVQSWIERVALPVGQQEPAVAATADLSTIEFYAGQGLWFDALRTAQNAYIAQPDNAAFKQARLSLLEQAGLTDVVGQEQQVLSLR